MKVALDGSTALDSTGEFAFHEGGSVRAKKADIQAARWHQESQHATSPILRVTEPGYYRIDFWSVCRDLNDVQATHNLTNELGQRIEKKGWFSTKMQRLESFYGGDGQVKAVQEHRSKTNPIKQVIAENHSTMADLVLDNVVTGEKGRINGDNIWHIVALSTQGAATNSISST